MPAAKPASPCDKKPIRAFRMKIIHVARHQQAQYVGFGCESVIRLGDIYTAPSPDCEQNHTIIVKLFYNFFYKILQSTACNNQPQGLVS